jgi:hypothetical protein
MSKPQANDHALPPPEALGGINVRVEAEEDLTVVPGQIPPQRLPAGSQANGLGSPEQDSCLNICVEGEESGLVHQGRPQEKN